MGAGAAHGSGRGHAAAVSEGFARTTIPLYISIHLRLRLRSRLSLPLVLAIFLGCGLEGSGMHAVEFRRCSSLASSAVEFRCGCLYPCCASLFSRSDTTPDMSWRADRSCINCLAFAGDLLLW